MKQTEFWLSRDKRENRKTSYGLWSEKPKHIEQVYYGSPPSPRIDNFCYVMWEQLMPALKLKPGQCRKVVICEAELEGMDGMFIGFAKEKK